MNLVHPINTKTQPCSPLELVDLLGRAERQTRLNSHMSASMHADELFQTIVLPAVASIYRPPASHHPQGRAEASY